MASFDLLDDDDFSEIFLTQRSNHKDYVSLEEDGNFQQVHDPQYSDISDCEEQEREIRLRCV